MDKLNNLKEWSVNKHLAGKAGHGYCSYQIVIDGPITLHMWPKSYVVTPEDFLNAELIAEILNRVIVIEELK